MVDPKRENNLNDAPTLAFNKLLGQPFFRNKMEAIWFKSRSHGQHPAFGVTDFVADGGLRETAISHGNRIPYVAADLRIHPLAVVPVSTLSLNKLLLMATNARMFNLLVAATVRCTAAIIRFDRVLFMDEEMQILRPRIESNLITLKRHKTKNPAVGRPHLEYRFSINGGAWQSCFLQSQWNALRPILQQADFAQVYVPTDFTRRQIKLCHQRELNAHQRKGRLEAELEENANLEESKANVQGLGAEAVEEVDQEEMQFGQLEAQEQPHQVNPGQLTDKMLNEHRMNKFHKLLMGSVAGSAENLKVALQWLGDRQDYQMMGARGVNLVYSRLREAKLVPSYHDWLKNQQLKQANSSQGMLREAALNPHTPRHMATYAHNLLIQVRAAFEFMTNLKSREHTEHLKGSLLVPLAKWKQIQQEKPHSHPFVSDVVAATIHERLDKEPISYDSAGVTLLQIKTCEKWLYEVPELTESVEKQLTRTAAVFGRWCSWLEEEKLIERKRQNKILAADHFRHFKLLTNLLTGKP